MYTLAVVDEIRRLLDQGELSQRAIARRLGVSRKVVAAVAAGRRRSSEPVAPQPPKLVATEVLPVRCRGCGGLVYPPCRLCRARQRREFLRNLRKLSTPPPRRPLRDPRRVA
jgi:hypothetical protein